MASRNKIGPKASSSRGMSFQDLIFNLSRFWADQGCLIALPYDLEVGAGTMCPETFLRVLGPKPWRVAYVQPARRPADGRYGENPNRLLKHTQMQVILKPPPEDVQDLYLKSVEALGINLRQHDLRFEEDNWEAPTLGAWGIGWQVMLDGLEITQFTYFQQCGGLDLDPISAELTYGLERVGAFLQGVDSVYDVKWDSKRTYGDLRLEEERELSVYDFEMADAETCRELLERYEREATRLLDSSPLGTPRSGPIGQRFPLRKIYELCLQCSHLFNILDARGAISVTERVGLIGRIRNMACKVALLYRTRQTEPESGEILETQVAG
jgi:glycyl-tRNA synthetase alpha chain